MRPEELVHRTKLATLEYWDVVGKQKQQNPKETAKWRPPEDGPHKFYIHAAHMPGSTHSARGIIARDHTGDVVACMAGKSEHVYDAFAAELQAAAAALELATQLGAIRICIETDSQLLQAALMQNEPSFTAYASVLEDLKVQMKLWFSRYEVLHVEERPIARLMN